MSDDLDAAMRRTVIRVVTEQQPIRAADLYNRASRETNRMTPFAIAEMWRLVDEGVLNYDASAFVTLAGRTS